MNAPPNVSFILVNYHSGAFTERCIRSIQQQTRGSTFEIVVVDNETSLDAGRFKAAFPAVQLIPSPVNIGYGGACHLGASSAQGRYLYFLNNDTELLNDAGSIQRRFAEAHPDAGLLGVQHVDKDGRPALSFDYFPTLATKFLGSGVLRLFHPESFPSRRRTYDSPIKVDLVSGASLFIARELYQALGGFDPRFFLYCEEEDLALRVRREGYKVYLVPEARVMHHGGGSSKNGFVLKREFYISYFAFYRKHYGDMRSRTLQALTFAQFVLRYLLRPERDLWGPLIRWYLRGHPDSESLRPPVELRS